MVTNMDKGPWSIGEFRRDDGVVELAVFSDDFTHDVMLRFSGDFRPEDIRPYAEWLVSKLNTQPPTAGEQ